MRGENNRSEVLVLFKLGMDVEAAKQIFSAGQYLEQDGKVEEAIACYQQAARLHPEYCQYHYKLGIILRQQDRIELALHAFTQAIAVDDNHSWSYHSLGEVYAIKQDFATAIKYYQKAIKLNPNFSWSHYNLGRIFHDLQQLSEARRSYQKAIELDPEFSWSHFFLGEILTILQEQEKAIYYYQKAIELDPALDLAYYQLGRYEQSKGELEQAIEYYERAIETDGQQYIYHYHLGETLIQLERFERATNCYKNAIALQPNNLQAYFYLGQTLINRGKDTVANYREKAKVNSPTFRVNFEIGLAQAWQQSKEFSQSIECCQNAIKIDPTAKTPFKILQYIPTEEKDLEQIINFYQQIGKYNQTCPLLWGNLGDILTRQSRIDEAIACYRTSCYENNIIKNPNLANLDWQKNKQQPPDFIIIGAAKSGTTSLFSYLNQNPKVLAPHRKEINFFNHNFDLGLAWYLAQFPVLGDLHDFITGEASPSYIYDERAIERIAQLFPNIKLIAMLRNPVERTISEYYHAANHGIETRSLEKLIEIETEQLATMPRSKAMQVFGYLLNSIYVEKIAKWMDKFPAKNILIIQSESFFEDTALMMKKVSQFLDITYEESEQHIAYNIGTYPAVSIDIRQKLQDFFIPYNRELEEYLNRKFDW